MVIRFLLVVSLALFSLGCPNRDARLEAPLQSEFQWTPVLTACDPVQRSGAIFRVIPSTRFNLKKSDEVTFPISEAPALSLEVQSSLVSVSGSGGQIYDARLCAEVGAASQDAASAVLQRIQLARHGNNLIVDSPILNSPEERSLVQLRVTAPRDAPVNVAGTHAALAVHDMSAPLKLTTTHARITVLQTTGDVDAEVKEFGIIDFSGTRGHVHLDAPTEVNLNFIDQKFDGCLIATSDGTIRVLLPLGFSSSFEADVTKQSNFLCRAELCSHVQRHKNSGRVSFSYGTGKAQIRLTSTKGAIALYNP